MSRRFADAAAAALRSAAADPAPPAGAVAAVVVRVADGDEEALVTLERRPAGMRLACSCGRRPCGHLAAALEAFASTAGDTPRSTASRLPDLPGPERLTGTPPPAPPPDAAELAARVRDLLDAVAADGAAVGSSRTDAVLDQLLLRLRGTDLHGLHRTLADLRRETSTARPAAGRLLRAVAALAATAELLETAARGSPVEPARFRLLVGSARPAPDAEPLEDLALLEVGRNSARTPFGYRRVEVFFLDPDSGARYVETTAVPLDGAAPDGEPRGSVGPFPRWVRVDLASADPGPPPRPIRLLQYRVEPRVGGAELGAMAARATREIDLLYAEFVALLRRVGTAWPCWVLFAPARVLMRDGEATLADAADRVLPLARAEAPDTCAAADRWFAAGGVDTVAGHLVPVRGVLALSPLALLVDGSRGRRLVRLR